jgi:hypothetical protein
MANQSLQQLDPLGALVSRPLTYFAVIGIPVYAAARTFLALSEIQNAVLATAALVAITAACIILLLQSSALRAPFSVANHAVVTGLAGLAYLLSALSVWDTNATIRDDWGPMAIGFILLAQSQYRPPAEVAKAGLFIALFAGVLALLQAHSLVTPVPPIAYSLVTMMPILAFSLAAAFFSFELISGLEEWQSSASSAVTTIGTDNSGWIARSVQQDRVTILNQDVVPFFSRVLHSGDVSEADRARAAEIATAIRSVMVAEVDRSWLDLVLSQLFGVSSDALTDPSRAAVKMPTEQRSALRALLVAVTTSPRYIGGSLDISIVERQSKATVTLSAGLTSTEGPSRSEFSPFFAVLRILFPDLRVETSSAGVTLRFSYGR